MRAAPGRLRWVFPVIATALAAACSSAPTESGGDANAPGTPAVSQVVEGGTETTQESVSLAPSPVGGAVEKADLGGPSVELKTLRESPYVAAAVYPRPDYEGKPWSQWGQAIALDDGRVISAIGDHKGIDGNSYLYVYDPESRTITRFADVLSAVPHEQGEWGYGKVHSPMVDPGDGGIYFSTYWGSRRGLTYDGNYTGDVLFRLDQATLDLKPVSVPVPAHGMASLATNGDGLLYGEPIDPLVDDNVYPAGGTVVIDIRSGDVTSFPDDPKRDVFRSVMVGANGDAWFAGDDGALFRYDPAARTLAVDRIALPASLRAATVPDSDGTIYGVTEDPFTFFGFTPGEGVRELGAARAYTTSLALLPDGSAFLHVPGAHGDAAALGAPLVAVDTASGEQRTIVELADMVQDKLGLVLGGTYSVTIDAARNEAHIGFNAGATADEPWGEVVLVVVELP